MLAGKQYKDSVLTDRLQAAELVPTVTDEARKIVRKLGYRAGERLEDYVPRVSAEKEQLARLMDIIDTALSPTPRDYRTGYGGPVAALEEYQQWKKRYQNRGK